MMSEGNSAVAADTEWTVFRGGTFPREATHVRIDSSVTEIGEDFSHSDHLVQIQLHDKVTGISDYAFACCSRLTSIEIPDSVIDIGYAAFSDCTSLTWVRLPSPKRGKKLEHLNRNIFEGCSSLMEISIPKQIRQIEERAFTGCHSLQTIHFPKNSSLNFIGRGAFEECFHLRSILLPDNVRAIVSETFFHCRKLSQVQFPKKLETIQYNSFRGCHSLEVLDLRNSTCLQKIESCAFESCRLLTSIYLPKTEQPIDIEVNAFFSRHKKALQEIHFPDVPTTLWPNLLQLFQNHGKLDKAGIDLVGRKTASFLF